MRKSLVNDIVHSFCFAIRQHDRHCKWPMLILGNEHPGVSGGHIVLPSMAALTAYAYAIEPNYVIANQHLALLAIWLRVMSVDEQLYAADLLEKYYAVTRCNGPAIRHDSRFVIQRNNEQELPNLAELSEHDKLLNPERASFLSEEVPANQIESRFWRVW